MAQPTTNSHNESYNLLSFRAPLPQNAGIPEAIKIDTEGTYFRGLPKDVIGVIGAYIFSEYAIKGKKPLELFKVEKFHFSPDECKTGMKKMTGRFVLCCLGVAALYASAILGAPEVVTIAIGLCAIALCLSYIYSLRKNTKEFERNFDPNTVTNPLFKQALADLDELSKRILDLYVPLLEDKTVADIGAGNDPTLKNLTLHLDLNAEPEIREATAAAIHAQLKEVYALTRSLAAKYKDYPTMQRHFGPGIEAFEGCSRYDLYTRFRAVGRPYDADLLQIIKSPPSNVLSIQAQDIKCLFDFAEDCNSMDEKRGLLLVANRA